MLFSELPYELVAYVSSFLHILELLNLAFICTHVHACLNDRLKIHQHKLATLSTVDDLNRARTTSNILGILQAGEDCSDGEDD